MRTLAGELAKLHIHALDAELTFFAQEHHHWIGWRFLHQFQHVPYKLSLSSRYKTVNAVSPSWTVNAV